MRNTIHFRDANPAIPLMRNLLALLFGVTYTLLAGLACCKPLIAQNVVLAGSLSGRVTDQSGAVVAGAMVVARNLDTGVKQSTQTSHTGIYRFPVLTPGSYSVTANHEGFRDLECLLQVLVGRNTLQDVKLQVGASGDTVKVSSTAPLLRPGESSASTVMQRSFIEELPLNGRKYTNFTLLTPNTSSDGDTGLVSVAGQQGGEDSGYANGNGFTAFAVDGTNATSNYFGDILGRYRIPYLYGENSIQEFQVAVSPYSALYGGAGGFVNSVTRSGSNEFHGSGFTTTGTPRPELMTRSPKPTATPNRKMRCSNSAEEWAARSAGTGSGSS